MNQFECNGYEFYHLANRNHERVKKQQERKLRKSNLHNRIMDRLPWLFVFLGWVVWFGWLA